MVKVKQSGASYLLDIYRVGKGKLESLGKQEIDFVKGNSAGNDFNQDGVIAEDLLRIVIDYLITVNTGDLKNPYTSLAIKGIETSLLALKSRQEDREKRKVRTTYKP